MGNWPSAGAAWRVSSDTCRSIRRDRCAVAEAAAAGRSSAPTAPHYGYYQESTEVSDGLSFLDLLSLAEQGDDRAARALEKMAHYLGRGMRMIVAGLDPELIIVIGDLTRSWHRFGPVIEAEVRAQVLPGGTMPRLLPVHEGGKARLRGTVALVLQKHFGRQPRSPG